MRIPTARRAALSGAALIALTWFAPLASPFHVSAQAPRQPTPGEADPGVRPTRLIDRDEIRVSRIDLAPGAVRAVHAHDEVEYHVWTPVDGTFEITIGSDAPLPAKPGQAFFMKKGTRHGFRNTGTTAGSVFEIFVKKSTTTAQAPDASPAEAIDVVGVLASAAVRGSGRD